ncbi:hypothetical protein FPV67DRAFT_1133531 [Lyophyllum atratum]|nr:hypothetical protein FPV67DRAFT_1133531 [Lyophyllum atratum]
MVGTRRQSGRVLTQATLEPTSDEKKRDSDSIDDADDDGMDSGSSSSDLNDESDWEDRKGKATKRAALKRGKVSAKSSPSKVNDQKATTKKRNISLLLTMPMDVIYEVLCFLAPRDLISLTRTSKVLRDTLVSSNARTVWKSVREAVKGPSPPQDFSEPRWAALLFGKAICECCHAPNVHGIEFALRRRLCTSCKKENYVVTSKFPKVFPDFDIQILEFIPYTTVGGWSHGYPSKSKFYWKGDIYDIARTWGAHTSNVHMRIPGAKQKMEDFRDQRLKFVEEVVEDVKRYRKWYATMCAERAQKDEQRKEHRWTAIYAKFIELGYLEVDIYTIKWETSVCAAAELTERGWIRIRPGLEAKIMAAKSDRLASLRRILLQRRKEVLYPLYNKYLRTVTPSKWLYHPRACEVCNIPQFDEVLNAADDVQINEQSFTDVMRNLPALVKTWLEARKSVLEELVSLAKGPHVDSPEPESAPTKPSDLSAAATTDILKLTTSIFKCGNRTCTVNASPWDGQYTNPLFGWDGAVTHQCEEGSKWSPRPLPTILVFFKEASDAAAELARLSGLDITRATIADMDDQGKFFFCSHCPLEQRNYCNRGDSRPAYTWRSAVSHAPKHDHPTDPSWQMLTMQEAHGVDKPYDHLRGDNCWSCNHCPAFFDAWKGARSVLDHLRDHHNITNPQEPADIFHHPGKRQNPVLARVWRQYERALHP